MNHLTIQEQTIIRQIVSETNKRNVDNISRTDAYFKYFKNHPDIIWSFLASMVSRNGGWNMCDLEGDIFPKLIEPQIRKKLFLTYERANWLIFHDVFPQLMLYHYSSELKRPMFHLLRYFNISAFIQKEWYRYWKENDKKRLTTALIINEQNVIQTPVIEHPVYRRKVFNSFLFYLQDWLHFSCVLFPTCGGEVYGASVNGFKSLSKRINLGKRLASILSHPRLFPYFFEFAERTPHTGSRFDYEQYFKIKTGRKTPLLRTTFPVIAHHQHQYQDWSKKRVVLPAWLYLPAHHHHTIHLTDWYYEKSNQLHLLLSLKQSLKFEEWK
ncbi:DUF2515 family protein [Neobacillus cucumis]|uniref:DUF2515 family protein n=1 Tax=Neobacillus cucumis TaxID=1740721 RepID=UPI0019669AA2|nr:DUF2515 family protein [Neobacillus cucumis]MBM7654884.1 hypothetical protein [Neobacillus cucumis]MED4226826.1 DUF2515 family protein [Neobacillus cucumis]